MSRLDQEHDVVALARELGLRGDPVEAVVRFCEEKIGCWAGDFGGVETVAALEQLVADHLQLVFEEVCSDNDLEQIIAKYVALGEYVFATLRDELGPTTFGLTVKRKRCGPESGDKYVAVIDCRGEKATRRFFTRWHEIAHLLVLEKELDAPFADRRTIPSSGSWTRSPAALGSTSRSSAQSSPASTDRLPSNSRLLKRSATPTVTRLASRPRCSPATGRIEIAGGVHRGGDEVQGGRGTAASFQAAEVFADDPPVAKLRVGLAVPNQSAIDCDFRVMPNMRVPECSVIHKLHSDATAEQASGEENLGSWEFSDGAACPTARSGSMPGR